MIEDAISDLVGGHLPEWSWLKASLLVSFGGLGLLQASLYVFVSYISSFDQSKLLVARILGKIGLVVEAHCYVYNIYRFN